MDYIGVATSARCKKRILICIQCVFKIISSSLKVCVVGEWVVVLKVTLVLALVQNHGLGFGFGLGPS
jgi:hypothetical protein